MDKKDREREERDTEYRGRREREDRDESDRDREERHMETYDKMSVPNELIGSVIGKGGNKIVDIRQMSGARIKISRNSEHEESPGDLRQIQITGKKDSVKLAKRLINMPLDLMKVRSKPPGIT